MPRVNPRQYCRICGRHVDEVGSLSARGKCAEDAKAMTVANMIGLKTHSGPFHEHWRRRHAAAVGAILPEDLPKVS